MTGFKTCIGMISFSLFENNSREQREPCLGMWIHTRPTKWEVVSFQLLFNVNQRRGPFFTTKLRRKDIFSDTVWSSSNKSAVYLAFFLIANNIIHFSLFQCLYILYIEPCMSGGSSFSTSACSVQTWSQTGRADASGCWCPSREDWRGLQVCDQWYFSLWQRCVTLT